KKELLIKYLNNRCTEAELKEMLRWIKKDALNEEDKKWSLETWNSWQDPGNPDDDESFAAIFDKIQERIDRNNVKAGKSLNWLVLTNRMTKAAAVLLIPVLAFLIYMHSERNVESAKYAALASDSLEVIASSGSKTVVQLSDGSEIHLNYGSKVKYPHFFSGHT